MKNKRKTKEFNIAPAIQMAESGEASERREADVVATEREVKKPEDAKLKKTKKTVDSVAAKSVDDTETVDAAFKKTDDDTAVRAVEYVEVTRVVEAVPVIEAARSVGVDEDTGDAPMLLRLRMLNVPWT